MKTETTFFSLFCREIKDLFHDPWLFSLLSWVPPLLFLVMWWMFSQGIATDLPIGVVDLDKSNISRALVRHYAASPALAVDERFLTIDEGVASLRSGKIYGLVVLPKELEEKTTRGNPPLVSAFLNSQFLLFGKIINSALLQAQSTFTTKIEVISKMASSTPVVDMALSSAMPITSQITPLFNVSKNYAQYLVSAILPALWQIIMVAATVLSLALAARRHGLKKWLKDAPGTSFLAKTTLLSLFFLLQGLLFLTMMYVWLGWPMRGDWQILFAAQLFTTLASIGSGSLIYFVTRDAVRSLSIAAAYVAPGLAFMGVTFPVTDMTLPARIWRSLIPICHYIEIQFGQVNYGAPVFTTLTPFRNLILFLIPLLIAFFLVYRFAVDASSENGVKRS